MLDFTLAEAVAGLIVVSLCGYALLGGADFGGGVWDLFARGPRGPEQRALIEQVLAPVWEVNHIWLILAVVLLFSGFPPAFAALATALHVPLTILLIGIVLRGAAFSFRQYDDRRDEVQRRYGRIFAIASIVSPLMLGVCLGAITRGEVRMADDGTMTSGFFLPWIGIFPAACGLFALALFAFLAAVYLTNETWQPALQDDFRRRALYAGVAVGAFALLAALTAGPGTREFQRHLLRSWWSIPLQLVTGATAVGALWALWTRRYQVARACAVAQTVLILGGWAAAQYPYLIAPDVTIAASAAPRDTLVLLLIALGGGAAVLFPSMYWLLKLFRRRPADEVKRLDPRAHARATAFDALRGELGAVGYGAKAQVKEEKKE